MDRFRVFLRSLKEPVTLIQLLLIVGGVTVVYTMLSATQGPPPPWENDEPAYLVGEMEGFTRTFPPRPLPQVTLQGRDGPVAMNALLDGRPLVINLWATWCAPCLEELPSLDRLQARLGDEVRVVAVALEAGDGSGPRAMAGRLGVDDLLILQDPALELGRAYSDDLTLPITVVYDRRGREIGRMMGAAVWDAEESVRLVRAVAAGARPG